MKVKICGITSVDDAEEVVEAGADAIGLMFYNGSPRHVTIAQAEAIERRLPPYVLRVGVFANPAPEEVITAIHHCGLNLLQFHGEETPAFCRQFGLPTMKAFRIRDENSLAALSLYDTDYFLLDSYRAGQVGGTGQTFNWALAVKAGKLGIPFFLAGGLTPENVAEAVRTVRPYGVDVSSGVEFAPGKKDAGKLRAFVAAVRSV